MNKPALLKLAQLLRKPLPKGVDRFDMRTWMSPTSCGTAACACGIAANDPWFIKRGFRLDLGEFGQIPHFGLMQGITAAAAFFRILPSAAAHLFIKDSYKRGSRLDVARRIEGFVRRGK